ncbi:MAG TPA: RnfABCDGE type electron transport complex subunit D [Candidatus Omnitrophota bacterium]|nr:RnfABCDGE type electron transport complex subunit D [Candidatus Omnitrophota bacterium]
MPNQDLKLNNLVVSSGPHIQVEGDHIIKRMWATLIALIPAGIAGVYIFGLYSLNVIAVSVITAVICESAFQKIFRKKNTILDGSAIITGLLLAYNLPPSAPLWMAALGSFFAVVVGKQLFGGLGFNIFNPALVGRAFLMASWPKYMTYWSNPRWQIDAVTTATPLGIVKEKLSYQLPTYWDLFIGNRGGCIGEVCIIALLIGGVYLLYKRYISWQIPVYYLLTVAILSFVLMGNKLFSGDVLFALLSGGLVLGAFFMATDYVSAPISIKGKTIFAVGCGLLTVVIRKWGGYPEGVSYAILMMNAATPIIDRFARPRKYGALKKRGAK